MPRPDWAGYLPAELRYAVTAEGALTLTDVMIKRTHLAIELPDGGHDAAPAVAELLRPVAGWDGPAADRRVLPTGRRSGPTERRWTPCRPAADRTESGP